MKKSIRGLTMTAILLSASTTVYGDQNEIYDGEGFVTPVAFVGDMPNHEEDAYFAEDAEEADDAVSQASHNAAMRHRAKAQSQPAPARHVQHPAAQPQQVARPVQQMAPAVQQQVYAQPQQYAPIQSYQMHGSLQQVSWCDSPGCSTPGCAGGCDSAPPSCGCDSGGCDGGCDAMGGGGKGCGLGGGSGMGLCTKDGWFRHEALLWFVQNRDMVPLVTASDFPTLPIIGQAGTEVVFGGEIEGDLSLGYRGDVGMYVSDNVGIGGRFWALEDNGDSFSISGNQTRSFGRPFYDTSFDQENALTVTLLNAGVNSGSVDITSEVSILAAEAYARLNFSCSKSCQLDFIGGYSHFQVDDTLSARSTAVFATFDAFYNDLFETENRFNGGQIGFEGIINRGRWFARSLTKVHLGNMEQTVRISGNSAQDFDPGIVNFNNGFLSTVNTQGTYEREEFTFVPEMNFKLGYKFRDHVEMSVGYSFIYFDNTALVGDVIDRVGDIGNTLSNTASNRPEFTFEDSSLWVQGLDLGLAISF